MYYYIIIKFKTADDPKYCLKKPKYHQRCTYHSMRTIDLYVPYVSYTYKIYFDSV